MMDGAQTDTAERVSQQMVFRFGVFTLHSNGRLFRTDRFGKPAPVPIGSRALQVLTILVQRAGELVRKQDFIDAVWSRVAIEDSNLSVQISTLRRTLDGGGRDGSCIRTIPNRGYCFVEEVTRQALHCTSDPVVSTESESEARRLSIIVLPFRSRGGHVRDCRLADAITDALATDITRIPGVSIISYDIAQSHKDWPDDLRGVCASLDVRYIAEGSIGRYGRVLRVNIRLVAPDSATQIWADRFEHPRSQPVDDQEAIVRRLSLNLEIALIRAESERSLRERPINPDVDDLIIRAQALRNEPASLQRFTESQRLFDRALQLEPRCLPAITGLIQMVTFQVLSRKFWLDGDEPERLAKLVAQAQAIAPADETVLVRTAVWQEMHGHYDQAMAVSQRIIDRFPGSANGYAYLARSKIYCGQAEEAVPLLEKAIRLNPYEPHIFDRYWRLGFAFLLCERDQEARASFHRALGAYLDAAGSMTGLYRFLAATLALMGEVVEARRLLTEFVGYPLTLRCLGHENYRSDTYASQYKRYVHGLRLAGLRDHAQEYADFGVASDDQLQARLPALTPTTVPGAAVIGTPALSRMLDHSRPLVIDTLEHFWGLSLPHAVGLRDAGIGGRLDDAIQERLRRKVHELTGGDRSAPIVAAGFNSERFDGRNLCLRLVALGYSKVYWYRGGREAWQVAGMPVVKLEPDTW